MNPARTLFGSLLGAWLILTALPQDTRVQDKGLRIPYRLTDTNHILVRAKINNKGPYNFIIDTGAPALFIATKVAREIGLEPGDDKWAMADKVEIEGGAVLEKVRARIEDPFQLTGMNAMGMAGVKLDGVLGYNVLALFKMEIDPTRRHMTWTRLEWNPGEPPSAKDIFGDNPPRGDGGNTLELFAKLMSMLLGGGDKTVHARGYLGFEADGTTVTAVYEGSPADQAGLKKGDVIVRIKKKKISSPEELLKQVNTIAAGDTVKLKVKRGEEEIELELTAGDGL